MDEQQKKRFSFLKGREIETAFVLITLLFFTTLAGFAWVISDVRANSNARIILEQENQQRIKDVQLSRLSSCIKTYQGIHDVFRPFFPPVPRTSEQQANLDKFNATINKLIKRCGKQVKSPN